MAKLDDKKVAAIKGPEPGKTVMRVRDGLADGLFLRVTKHTSKQGDERVSKSWEFYWTKPNRKLGCTGIGRWVPTPPNGEPKMQRGLSVKEARKRAAELLEMVEAGQDPVEVNRAKKAAPDGPKIVTFADALDEYMKTDYIQKNLSSDKHRKQWRASLDLHVIPKMGAKPVGTITIDDVKDVLKPIWATKTDTARRVRQRMESVFAWSIDEGWAAERSETGVAKRNAKNLRRLAQKHDGDALGFDLSDARDDLLFKASVAEHFTGPEAFPATKGRNERARVVARAVARVFAATGRSIGLGKDAYTGEPSTPFGRAVKEALAVYEIESGWYRPAEHAAKLTRNPN